MNFVRIELPNDQVTGYVPIASFNGRNAEYDAKRYAGNVGWVHKVTTYRDICKDGAWAVYVPEDREQLVATPGRSTAGDILGDIFHDPLPPAGCGAIEGGFEPTAFDVGGEA